MKTETQILLEICDYLQEQKLLYGKRLIFWRSNNVPAGARKFGVYRSLPKYTPKGLPDIMIIRDGKFFALEVKRPGGEGDEREKNGRKVRIGKLTPEQASWGISCTIAGGSYFTVRSVEDVVRDTGL